MDYISLKSQCIKRNPVKSPIFPSFLLLGPTSKEGGDSETSSVSEEFISSELQELRNRAKKLSEDLKSLSMETETIKASTAGNDVGPDGKPIDKQSEEIKEIMKRYSDIIGPCNIYVHPEN